jgi:tetratricopeptide (TPR) repeat protein
VSALLERIARATNDERALADALAMQIELSGADQAKLHEAVEVAKRLADLGLAKRVLSAALEHQSSELSDEAMAWALRELASMTHDAGDARKARELRERATKYLPVEQANVLRLQIARECAALPDEWERAAQLYEELLQSNPTDRDVWAPLLELYQQHGQSERHLALVDKVISLVEDRSERSALRLAQIAALNTDPARSDEVIKLLKDILDDDPAEREAARMLSELLEREGRGDELVDLLIREIDRAKDERNVEAIVALTLRLETLLEERDRAPEALDYCRAALDWAPEQSELLNVVVRLSEAAGDTQGLADALETLLKVTTGAEAVKQSQRLAKLREELGDPEGVERALMLGFAASPRDSMVRDLLLNRYAERGDQAKVAELLSAAVDERPGDVTLLARLVQAYAASGQREQALGTLNVLLEVEPSAAAYQQRAALLGELGREIEAVDALERAFALDSSLAGVLEEALETAMRSANREETGRLTLRLIDVLESTGNLAAARARLGGYVEKWPQDLGALRRLAVLESRAGSAESAIQTLQRLVAVEEGPALIETALRLSDVCELAGRPEDARAALERALSEDNAHQEVRQRLAVIYEAAGESRALAEMMLEDAESQEDPAIRISFLLRAGQLLLSSEGDLQRAIEVLEAVRAQSPESIDAAVLLSQAYIADQRSDQALALLTSIADAQRGKRSRALSVVHEQIAEIHLAEGFLTDALAALGKAFELDTKNSRLAMRLGELAIESEEDDIAQRAFRAVAIMKPLSADNTDGAPLESRADANYYMALLARKQGDPRKAKVLVSKALADVPNHPRARQLLQEIDGR